MIVDKIQAKKPLVPYHHNAGRNRLPVHFDKEPKKCQRFCAPRNVSTIEYVLWQFMETHSVVRVKDKNQRSAAKHFLSVNKCMYNKHEGVPVGFSNTGIVAEKTRWFHKRQEDWNTIAFVLFNRLNWHQTFCTIVLWLYSRSQLQKQVR